jgi:hypothetical protein
VGAVRREWCVHDAGGRAGHDDDNQDEDVVDVDDEDDVVDDEDEDEGMRDERDKLGPSCLHTLSHTATNFY